MLTMALSPLAFEIPEICTSEISIGNFCALAIAFLRDIEENCIILTDACSPSVIGKALTEALDRWPHKYRVEAKARFMRLRERGRFISRSDYLANPCCRGRPCGHTLGLIHQVIPAAVLMNDCCVPCVQSHLDKIEVFTLSGYQISRFAQLRREITRIGVRFAEMCQSQAEERIFSPLLRYAKHVKVVDRYIGRSVMSQGATVPGLSKEYLSSLDWIIEIYKQSVLARGISSKSTFEVWCGLDIYRLPDPNTAIGYLRNWETSVKARQVPNFKLFIKREIHTGEMPHARYFITDQLTILVDRGFELLCSDSQMRAHSLHPTTSPRPLRDCEFMLLRDSSRIVTDLRRLEDL